MSSQVADVRKNMSEFWKVHSKNANLDEMMLDSNAENLNKFEMNEILTMIPDYGGKNLLELGAGIGRYTGEFCKKAKKVVAVDFMESFVEKNRENNNNFDNLQHICDDVMNLQFADSCFDVIFTNWLFMYLSDDDINTLTSRMLRWLKPNGIFFVRESCNRPSGNMKRSENPTFYRTQLHYNELLTSSCVSGSQFGIIWSKPIETYIRFKNNENQICWLLQSKQGHHNSHKELTKDQIQLYQEIHGKNLLDSGADVINQKMSSLMEINECDVILDIGCGIGGNSKFLAKQFGCVVTGIDRSLILVETAQQSLHNGDPLADKLHFKQADVRTVDYPQGFYDVIYTRDALFHNRQKEEILRKISRWLKIGGKLVLVDYCCNSETMATDKEEGFLISVSQYEKMLQEVGFRGVHEEELSNTLVENLQRDFEAFNWPEKSEKKTLQNEEKVNMEEKIEKLKNGKIRWVLFTASK